MLLVLHAVKGTAHAKNVIKKGPTFLGGPSHCLQDKSEVAGHLLTINCVSSTFL